jgi:valyl-tRNA synthetase
MPYWQGLRGVKQFASICLQVVSSATQADGGEGAVELVVQEGVQAVLPLKGLFDAAKEVARLQKQRGKLAKEFAGLSGRLNNPKFVEGAPEHVVAEVRSQAKDLKEQLELVDSKIAQAEALL